MGGSGGCNSLKTRVNYHLTSRLSLQLKSPPENPAESHLEEVIHLRERVKSLEYLDKYHRDQLHQKDLLVQELMGTVKPVGGGPARGKEAGGGCQAPGLVAVAAEWVSQFGLIAVRQIQVR